MSVPIFPPQNVIVFHPGSQNLRIGRASDSNPHSLLHAIARPMKNNNSVRMRMNSLLPRFAQSSPELIRELDEKRAFVANVIQDSLISDNKARISFSTTQINQMNQRSKPENIGFTGGEFLKSSKNNTIIGDNILKIEPFSQYIINFPIRRGELNLHKDEGGSLTSVLADLYHIWTYAIENILNIPRSNFKNYRAILVIPVVFNRKHAKELTTLLLRDMEFSACFLVQDHVAASFGSGLSTVCVIDVGDQKTSISCVEDGISHAKTRIKLDYGGGDVTQIFYWLLIKIAFPYKKCNPLTCIDGMFLQNLKETFCHLDVNTISLNERSFTAKYPGRESLKVKFMIGDEVSIAPLSYFYPELFLLTGLKFVHYQRENIGDPEDPHDANYLRETSRRATKENVETAPWSMNEISTKETSDLPSSQIDLSAYDLTNPNSGFDLGVTSAFDNNAFESLFSTADLSGNSVLDDFNMSNFDLDTNLDEDINVDTIDTNTTTPSLQSISANATKETQSEEIPLSDKLLPIDKAILESIERCPTEDLRRKILGNLLIVGGGLKFSGAKLWLYNQLSSCVNNTYSKEPIEIIMSAKGLDSQNVTWKGAAVMAALEPTNELWIRHKEWIDQGVKILRERASFNW